MLPGLPVFWPGEATASGVTMVAGTGGSSIGYSEGAFGSISGQPLSGYTLFFLYYAPTAGFGQMSFYGDAEEALSGKSLIIDDVSYPFSSFEDPPNYLVVNNETVMAWLPVSGPQFTSGVSYNIRIE